MAKMSDNEGRIFNAFNAAERLAREGDCAASLEYLHGAGFVTGEVFTQAPNTIRGLKVVRKMNESIETILASCARQR